MAKTLKQEEKEYWREFRKNTWIFLGIACGLLLLQFLATGTIRL